MSNLHLSDLWGSIQKEEADIYGEAYMPKCRMTKI